jgi:tRNA A37 methylthiotransferase MiaB
MIMVKNTELLHAADRKNIPSTIGKVCIVFAFGCPRSKIETARMFSYFETNNFKIVHDPGKADLIFVAGCGFDAAHEQESIRRIKLITRQRRNGVPLIITGCLAGLNNPDFAEELNAIFIKPSDIDQLDAILNTKIKLMDAPPVNYLNDYAARAVMAMPYSQINPDATPSQILKHHIINLIRNTSRKLGIIDTTMGFYHRFKKKESCEIFSIRVSWGCLEECTYCIIKKAIGDLKSKPLHKIVTEFKTGLERGFQTFELIADDLGSYGLDNNTDLPSLLKAILRYEGRYKLILTDINVRYLIQYQHELEAIFQQHHDRFMRVKIPVQSGSDKILDLMKRHYTAAKATEAINAIKAAAPGVIFETHMLVGFPSESARDFEESVKLLQKVNFDRVQVFTYSDRPGTLASKMPDKVPVHIKKERAGALASVEYSHAS